MLGKSCTSTSFSGWSWGCHSTPAFFLKVPTKFLLLCIDRDERDITLGRASFACALMCSNCTALRSGCCAPSTVFLRGLQTVAELPEQLAHGFVADSNAVAVKELVGQDDGALRRPAEGRLGVTPRGRIDELLQRRQELGMDVLVATTAASFAAHLHKVVRLGTRPQFTSRPFFHRVRREASRPCHREDAAVADGIGFRTCPQARVTRSFIEPRRGTSEQFLSDEGLVDHQDGRSRPRDLVDREVDQLAHSRALSCRQRCASTVATSGVRTADITGHEPQFFPSDEWIDTNPTAQRIRQWTLWLAFACDANGTPADGSHARNAAASAVHGAACRVGLATVREFVIAISAPRLAGERARARVGATRRGIGVDAALARRSACDPIDVAAPRNILICRPRARRGARFGGGVAAHGRTPCRTPRCRRGIERNAPATKQSPP